MKVAAIQHDIVWEDPAATFLHLAPKVKEAVNQGAEFVALTEMYSWGFSSNTAALVHEAIDGPSTQFLVDQATSTGAWVCGSVPERPPGAALPYNTLIVATPDGDVHRYAKRYPFTYGNEHNNYLHGYAPLTLNIGGLRVSFFICYELRFADEFWAVANDTDLYVVVANWPESRREHWSTLLHARAIENQAYVMGVNRVGEGGKLAYSGDSVIIDPFGEILAAAAYDEAVLVADVTAERVADVRARFPFLPDRKS